MSFVSCVAWIRRGIAKHNPVKAKPSESGLRRILSDAISIAQSLNESNPQTSEGDEEQDETGNSNEEEQPEASINEPEFEDEPDSDDEDDIIKDSDNLIVVGTSEKDCDILNVFVFNEEDSDLYIHHDILESDAPLCIERLNLRNPSSTKPANFVAVGGMSPEIHVWDLDTLNSWEPLCTLGYKAKKKKYAHRNNGHKKAVLDLTWNIKLPHILASGSVDETVILWDLETKKASTVIYAFNGNVETIHWHMQEAQTLLAGSADGTLKIYDCRYNDTFKEWKVDGEALIAKWDAQNPYCALVGTSSGNVYYIDCRKDDPLWKAESNSEDVTGLEISQAFPGLMITTHINGVINIWDIRNNIFNVTKKPSSVGQIHTFELNPDAPYIGCIGGSNKNKCFDIINLNDFEEVCRHWEKS